MGQGEKALRLAAAILDYLDGQLVERNGGLVMQALCATVADYLEKIWEGLAAARHLSEAYRVAISYPRFTQSPA